MKLELQLSASLFVLHRFIFLLERKGEEEEEEEEEESAELNLREIKRRRREEAADRVKNVLVCLQRLNVSGGCRGNSSWETNCIAVEFLFLYRRSMCVCVCVLESHLVRPFFPTMFCGSTAPYGAP